MLNFPQKLMRPRRPFLAKLFRNGSLAPLLGLSAIIAVAAAVPGSPKQSGTQSHPLVRLIHSVFQFVAPSAEKPSTRSYPPGPPPRLFFTPVSASLWMVVMAPIPPVALRLRRLHLRC
jgi:hypothetical protein